MATKGNQENGSLDIDLTFPHSYEVAEVHELPGTGGLDVHVYYIPPPKHRPEHDGLWLNIRGQTGKSWVGVFAFGPLAFSRVLSTPDPHRACVIANGAGYLVKSDQPEAWTQIAVSPVLDVRSMPEHELLVLADFTGLAAYGRSGLFWTSQRLCWDELKIIKVTHDTIEGVGYDPTNIGESRFAVDIRTGRSLLPSPTTRDGKSLW